MAKDTQKKNGIEMITVKEDVFGVPYLPGQEPTIIKEIYDIVFAREQDKAMHAKLTKRLEESKRDLKAVSVRYRDQFEASDTGTHFVYHCAGIAIEVNKTEVEEVTTRKESAGGTVAPEGDNPKKGRAKGKAASADSVDTY